jgi:Mn2+/Fe2+ NRAMP family transporter
MSTSTDATQGLAPSRRKRALLLLGALGPGIIAASAGNDAGGIATYSQLGAMYGYATLWLVPIMTVALVVVQEMATRMGLVTGKGFAALIRERFGVRPTLFAMLALLFSNAATSVSEFAGIAAASEILGVSRYVAVPVAAVAVWLLVVRGSYRRVERVFFILSAVFLSYVIAAFMGKPDWAGVAQATVIPHFVGTTDFVLLVIAAIGTTIAPWMQFFAQANVVDKGLTAEDLPGQRLDVLIGAVAANFVAWCIILTTGTVLFKEGVSITSAEQAARALAPVAGDYASTLFAVGLLGASLLAAGVLPLTSSYAVTEAFGFERGVDRTWKEAPVFNGIYTFVIVFGAASVLLPGLNLISIMVFSQAVGGVLLPFLLIFMMVIVNDRRIMGRFVNGRVYNALGWMTVTVVIGLTVALLGMQAMGMS